MGRRVFRDRNFRVPKVGDGLFLREDFISNLGVKSLTFEAEWDGSALWNRDEKSLMLC